MSLMEMQYESPAVTMKLRLRRDLKTAMLTRRGEDASLLRGLIAAIDNAEAVPVPVARQDHHAAPGPTEVPRALLGPDELRMILLREIAEREAAAADLERAGLSKPARQLHAEAALARTYLG